MTSKEVIDFLEKRGYRSYPVPSIASEGVIWTGSKRLPEYYSRNDYEAMGCVPKCDCNGNRISWHVNIYEFNIPNDSVLRKYQAVSIEIVAEKNAQWFKLNSYGIPWDVLQKQLSMAETCLLNSWIACARS